MIVDPKEYREKVFTWAKIVGLKQVRLVIHQPLAGGPTEDVVSMDDLETFAVDLARAAQRVRVADVEHAQLTFSEWWPIYLNPEPSIEACAYCRATAICPSMRAKMERDLDLNFGAVAEDNEALKADTLSDDVLNRTMLAVPLLEDYCRAVRAEVERRLMAGEDMADFGLELGRQGNREWTDPAAVEAMLRKQYRMKEADVYSFKLKSPTQIEKLTKPIQEGDGSVIAPKLGVRRYAVLTKFVTRADPKPSVRPKSVIKVPWKPAPIKTDEFTPVDEEDFT